MFAHFQSSPEVSPFQHSTFPSHLEIPPFSLSENFYNPLKAFNKPPSILKFSSCVNQQHDSLKDISFLTNPEVNKLVLALKLQKSMQDEIFKAEMLKLLEIKDALLAKLNQVPSSAPSKNLVSLPKSFPSNEVKIENEVEFPHKERNIQSSSANSLNDQVQEIVHFVLDNFGRINESNFDEEKAKYSHNKDLMLVFEILVSKYSSTIKTKEEMVKYTLRRAFKYVKNNIRKQTNSTSKGVSKALCKRYFNASQDDISKIGNEEEFLRFVLPFRKNSKNKTMNTNFISEVFSSEDFCRDYDLYLKSFDRVLEDDNKSKIRKFTNFIEECVRQGKIQDIKTYKRIPWPKLWIINTKKIAQDLPTICTQDGGFQVSPQKRLRKESSSSNDTIAAETNYTSEASQDASSNY